MKRSINIWVLMILLAFFSGCEKYDMVEFGEGGEINFRGRYLNVRKYYWSDDEKYSSGKITSKAFSVEASDFNTTFRG